MAFDTTNFVPDSGANTNASRIFRYNTSDTLVTTKGANYFDLAAATTGGYGLAQDDVILVTASDGSSFLQVDVVAGAVTTARANDFA